MPVLSNATNKPEQNDMKPPLFRLFFCWVLILTNCYLIRTQPLQLNFNHLTPVDGLSQSINAFIFQDSYGFVWISSLDGLNRFDGINIEIYQPNPSNPKGMKGKNIQSQFFESKQGDIWFCTVEAINCFRSKTGKIEHYLIDSLLPENKSLEYYIFHLDEKNDLWIKIDDALFFFNITTLKGKRIGHLEGIRCKVKENRSHTEVYSYFKGNAKGLKKWIYDPNAGIYLQQELFNGQDANFPSLNIHDVFVNDDNSIYIASRQGLVLYSFNDKKYRTIDTFDNTKVEQVRAIIELDDLRLLISSSYGILVFDKQQKRFIQRIQHQQDSPTSLTSNNVREIYLDEAFNLWVSLWTIGVDYANVFKTKFSKFKLYNPSSAFNGGLFDPGEMIEDYRGRTWYGSNQHGVLVLDDRQTVVSNLSFSEPGLKQIFKDDSGGIWLVPWENYLLYLQPNGSEYLKLPLPKALTFNLGKLVQLSDGKILFTKNEEKGVFEIINQNHQFSIEEIDHPFLSKHHFNKGFYSSKNMLYLSHRNSDLSIVYYENGQFEQKKTLNLDGEVYSFYELDEHKLFIGGSFGFASINQKNYDFEKIEVEGGFAISYVYSILPDEKNNRLWLSTNRGLIIYDLKAASFQFYTPMDGLQEYEFNENSAMVTSKGDFLFGGIKGYNRFNADNIQKLNFEPKINVTKILINDALLSSDSNITSIEYLNLPYWKNTLSFHFVASEFSHPDANQLKYKMEYKAGESYDEDWIKVNNWAGFARYPKLPSGSYQFRIKGSNSDGVWGQEEKIINVNIAFPFWETTWFLLAAVAIIAILTWLGVRQYITRKLRLKNLKIREQRLHIEKEEALQKERDRLAEDMHDDLGGSLTTIRILLQRLRKNTGSGKLNSELNKVDHYSLQVIQNMRFMVWAMQRENEYLDNFIIYIRSNITQLLEDNNIRCSSTVPSTLPEITVSGFIRKHVWLCVKESTHNVIKHSEAKNVKLIFELKEKLVIKIQDDGIGIPSLDSKPFGYGLKNMKDRMERVNGQFSIVNDKGTLVTFEVPY